MRKTKLSFSNGRNPYMMHPLPSVFLMELDVPEGFVTQLNEYLDDLLEQEGRRTTADTLVGQIREGEQLRMDCDNELVVGFSDFVCALWALSNASLYEGFGSVA